MSKPRVALFEDSGTERLLLSMEFPWIQFMIIGQANALEVMSCNAAVIDWGCSPEMEPVRNEMIDYCQKCEIDWCFFSGAIGFAEKQFKDALIFNKLGGRDEFKKWLTSMCDQPMGATHAITSMFMPMASAFGLRSFTGN
jgi:hypothetical protein